MAEGRAHWTLLAASGEEKLLHLLAQDPWSSQAQSGR